MPEFASRQPPAPVTQDGPRRRPAPTRDGHGRAPGSLVAPRSDVTDTLGRILQRACSERAAEHPRAPLSVNLLQRVMSTSNGEKALQNILTEHGLDAWYSDHWKSGDITRIAAAVASRADTDRDNLAKRLRAHPEILPLLRQPRTEQLVLHDKAPESFDDPGLQLVYAAYLRLLFYHTTLVPEKVRAGGVDPSKGGSDGGYAKTRSLAGQGKSNVSGAHDRAYVTRDYKEAKQYAKDTGTIVRILVPKVQRDRLQVDPDSRLGVYTEERLLGVDKPDRRLSLQGQIYLRQEIDDWGGRSAAEIDKLYEQLVVANAFLPGETPALAGSGV